MIFKYMQMVARSDLILSLYKCESSYNKIQEIEPL